MKVVIIGGVAAGTKAAAKIKREARDADVTIYTKSKDISYAGCGLPYYIGGDIETREELVVNSPAKFTSLTGAKVRTECEVTAVCPERKEITVCPKDGESETVSYDALIVASGAEPFIPKIDGVHLQNVFTVRNPDDAVMIRDAVEKGSKKAVVIGAGFIGMEIAENLLKNGVDTTVIDMMPQILPNVVDSDMADYCTRMLRKKGLKIMTGTTVSAINGTDSVSSVTTNGGEIFCDMVVMSIGIRPSTGFLEGSGVELFKGTVLVDEYAKTNVQDIYAVGDCAMVTNRVTGDRQWSPMGSTANITGRLLAKTVTGNASPYAGCLGTGVVKLAQDMNVGRTGLSEEQAKASGFDAVSVVAVNDDKAHYYPDADTFITKLTADKKTGKLLGLQVIGAGNVDKMTDIAVVGISAGLTLHDYDTMDMAYAPPFSTAIHPFVQACYILENKINGTFDTVSPMEYKTGKFASYKVIDVQPKAQIFGAKWIDLGKAEDTIADIATKDENLLLVCTRGKRAYMLQNKLRAVGYTNTKVLEGGAFFNTVTVKNAEGSIPASEVKRVKGLGCLRDKRYPDIFNVRVITKNGKITIDEHRAIAEAAEKFGSGEITMTTRLTMEIQGVKYENIDALIAFLAEHGLTTGGTGSLVRPVVSCKGTTCQYGLIDTFGLSEKIHERFYLGYHNVTLPHKFKIAVGGCPNNCVKPTLNDLGIIGQRVPSVNLDKCRGCKVCQVEKNCPIHSAKVVDGKIQLGADCNNCGRCMAKCPFGAVSDYVDGYSVYIGGRFGKKYAFGRKLRKLFTSEEEVLDIIERTILFYRNEGITGERFADTVTRLGFDYVEDKILNNKIDKAEILDKKVKGGATC